MSRPKPLYFDYAAATPLDKRVLAAMQPFFSDQFYNPSSSYLAAKSVKRALEDARTRVAHWLGARPSELVFTAGATESINLAIHGVMRRFPDGNVVASAIEHEAVLAAATAYNHQLAPVLPDGTLDLAQLKALIDDDTVLVSIGLANNELGTIQPLSQIAELLRGVRDRRRLRNNPKPIYLHTDASQAAGYLDLHVSRLGVDLLTLNGAKIYGPKQSGVLFIKGGLKLEPLVAGGGQEFGLRSGTENVASCVGLATALDIAQAERKQEGARVGALRDELQRQILAARPDTVANGNLKKRLPNILHFSWPGVDGERLLMQLDEAGLMASTGSACAANKQTASHVLQACGLDEKAIQGSLRLSLGRQTTDEQIKKATPIICSYIH